MSLFTWPFKRKTYAGLQNPRFVDDVLASNEATIDGLTALSGVAKFDFFIFGGFVFTPGSPGTYTPGIYWLNGAFYFTSQPISEGQALLPGSTDVMVQPFEDDGVGRPIYTQFLGFATNAAGAGTSPAFQGPMQPYRIDNKSLGIFISEIDGRLAALGNSANLDVGVTPGTVAAGDDARFGYSVAAANALFATKVSVLLVDGSSAAFTPTGPTMPAPKSYVDSLNPKRLAAGNTVVGDIISGGVTINISFGITLGNTNYMLLPVCVSLGVASQDATAHWPAIFNKTTTGCSIRIQEGVGTVQNISIDWIVFGF